MPRSNLSFHFVACVLRACGSHAALAFGYTEYCLWSPLRQSSHELACAVSNDDVRFGAILRQA